MNRDALGWIRRAANGLLAPLRALSGRTKGRIEELLAAALTEGELESFCPEWDPPRKGRWGERAAARFLYNRGFRILGRNVSLGGVEVDLLAAENDVLVFVEVKLRMTGEGSLVFGNVDDEKMKRMRRAARAYMRRLRPPWPPVRIDLVGVEILRTDQPPQIHHIPGAAWAHRPDAQAPQNSIRL